MATEVCNTCKTMETLQTSKLQLLISLQVVDLTVNSILNVPTATTGGSLGGIQVLSHTYAMIFVWAFFRKPSPEMLVGPDNFLSLQVGQHLYPDNLSLTEEPANCL